MSVTTAQCSYPQNGQGFRLFRSIIMTCSSIFKPINRTAPWALFVDVVLGSAMWALPHWGGYCHRAQAVAVVGFNLGFSCICFHLVLLRQWFSLPYISLYGIFRQKISTFFDISLRFGYVWVLCAVILSCEIAHFQESPKILRACNPRNHTVQDKPRCSFLAATCKPETNQFVACVRTSGMSARGC